ncbi:glutaredoxin [Paracoccus sp. R12_1]|uniref:MauE/DoxX family redox-associated membrane protein n=1 Tax=unclassified Paracoccus (in: a-proteobacteria) TaxID=2688777 RepID=UPI001AD9894E|nr:MULTISPECIES: MauE/DoxX family redox-associated membrane protein [unclassified Paracoccus (in: a-proteobacteria)]MBO9455106.1 glutaredoxin [Paracoccus sp. R12_2]MBO9486522.1 glutaredoxin [Paracoccus sp. R12_1]
MTRSATLYRMVMPDHICPFGRKSKWLLRRNGYRVQDHRLRTRKETDAFMERHKVDTTPQTWIDGKRIGGYDDLRAHFGRPLPKPGDTSYTPVIAIFAVSALLALAVFWMADGPPWMVLPHFAAMAMVLLGLQKLQNVESFSTMFLNYDLLAQRWVPYAYAYPFLETGAGLLMLAGLLPWLSGPVALLIGAIGAWSVFRAVFIRKRQLKCACVGGNSNVPLGFVSLTENLVMMTMGLFTLANAM